MIPDFLLSPLTYALLLGLLLALAWRRLPRPARYVGVLAEILLVVAMTPLGANLLVRAVEWRARPDVACTATPPTTIVLLSGGLDRRARSATDFSALSRSSVERLLAAIELWRAHPGSRIVISGGGIRGGAAESAVLEQMASRLGVPDGAMRIEARSRTTWENARNVAALEPPLPRRVWLVSSALHLPRALGAFRAFGFQPCPWSSGSLYVSPRFRIGYFVPQTSALDKADRAIHELIGGWVYDWRAWRLAGAQRAGATPSQPQD